MVRRLCPAGQSAKASGLTACKARGARARRRRGKARDGLAIVHRRSVPFLPSSLLLSLFRLLYAPFSPLHTPFVSPPTMAVSSMLSSPALSLVILSSLVASLSAFEITFPTSNDYWVACKWNVLKWTYNSTDADIFSVALLNTNEVSAKSTE